ncbi:sensor histidine kinase [Terribacillus saccharophilus]|uniref:histidine kinase n=1 Tax=Terribacillus saccharophilus TaxID=361277 RepID=A0ABX4GZ81_9BACI|nr:HAMP domain-containing sensor histidine kinase [Terribacillus saccharophilus]PAD35656.1 two-component sensor histidine kinase [Terribacillus saccharophilus]PAD96621.1 two-component sensor histidine kinase [Terribacillus saccharophilus]PAE00197.1 two-component sensor histidine kinase [Terribacillus saccharophilus]
MRKRGITIKLFAVTALFFLAFYAMIMIFQLVFFDSFYQHYKTKEAAEHLHALADGYEENSWSAEELTKHTLSYMQETKSPLTIVDAEGYQLVQDPFHIMLQTEDGDVLEVALSLFVTDYGTDLDALNIKKGDTLEVNGESDLSVTSVIYPSVISKDEESVGEHLEENEITLQGKVKSVSLPQGGMSNRGLGLLYDALLEWFPLDEDLLKQLNNGESLQLNWVEPWTGKHNLVLMDPIEKDGEIQYLFSVTSLQETKDTNEALRVFYLYIGIAGILLILLLSLFYSRLVSSPLIKLNEMAKKMVHLDFSSVKPIKQKDELGSLSNNMLIMAQNLDVALDDLKQANEKLKQDMEKRKKMEKAQREFFEHASHELKTPLSIVKSFAEGLQDGISPDKHDHYIDVIIEESDKMQVLIGDMLDLAKLENGAIKLRKSSFLLSEMIEDLSDKMYCMAKDKQVSIEVMPRNEMPITADYEWMERVMRNLLVNAVRHSETDSVISIRIETDLDTARSVFMIDNKGSQIPEEQLDKIWNRFYRTESSRSRLTGGTGLGLAIVQQILDLHHYSYGVENTPEGVRFIVQFYQ